MMSEDITGRDAFIISEALAYAIALIESLPPSYRSESDRLDMVRLLKASGQLESSNLERKRDIVRRVIHEGGADFA